MPDLRIIARRVLMLGAAAASTATMAQAMAPSAAVSAAAEKAQRETDRTMYWIRVLAATPPPKPVAAPKSGAPAPQAKSLAPERVKVAAAAPAPVATAQSSADIANATPAAVVAAAPALADTLTARDNTRAMSAGGLDTGVSSAGVIAALAAPGATAPQVDLPQAHEEPDPGLVMIKSADPQFPASAMRRLRKGEVEVKFEVNPDGVVDVVSVVKTSNASLNNAAMEAVRQWRFRPTPRGHTAAVALAFDLDA